MRSSTTGSFAAAILLTCVVFAAGSERARAQGCEDPDDLCIGNPCEITTSFVPSPCEVDFGDRHLVIRRTLRTVDGGKISFSARSIDVRRAIVARPAQAATSRGGIVELRADDDIRVHWRIDVSGQKGAGRILLEAGDDIEILAPLRASGSGRASAIDGGVIEIRAGGLVSTQGRARIQARAGVNRTGGTIDIAGADGVRVRGVLDARGGSGGNIYLDSARGDIVAAQRLDVTGRSMGGGAVVMTARRVVRAEKRVDANGATGGGFIVLVGNVVQTEDAVRARASLRDARGGTIWMQGSGSLVVRHAVFADGAEGGWVALESPLSLQTHGRIMTTGRNGAGGRIDVTGGGLTRFHATLSSGGRTHGGSINVDAGSLTVGRRAELLAQGIQGGLITVNADSAVFESRADVRADGEDNNGTISIETEGNLVLRSDFRVRGGGTIVARSRNGNLVAAGEFETDGGGCIAIDAGGTVDISDAEFDAPLMTSCP